MESKRIVRATKRNQQGIESSFVRRRGMIVLAGWWDGIRRIPPQEIPLRTWLEQLGITQEDIDKARA